MDSRQHYILQRIIELNCFKEGKFTLKNGSESNYYINLRNLIREPEVIKVICELIYDKINFLSWKDFVICGLPYAGIPYAQGYSILYNTPSVFLRKEQKKHGMNNMIDGLEGLDKKKVLLIDDVITSGSSIQESLVHFEKAKLEVIGTIVIMDRRIENTGLIENVHSLFKLEDLLQYNSYRKANLLQETQLLSSKTEESRKSYGERVGLSNNKMFNFLLNLMEEKKSNLAVSLDYTSLKQIYKILSVIGEHIVIVKLHMDIIEDFDMDLCSQIVKLSKDLKFVIFEDRKFSEIGSIFQKQYQGGMYRISEWANLVNFHLISGDSNIQLFDKIYNPKDQAGLLVAQMSNKGNLFSKDYTNQVIEIGKRFASVCGFISQEKIAGDGFLYLTPGIGIAKEGDALDQQYKSPQQALIVDGTDIIIVGRNITQSKSVVKSTLLYKELGWSSYLLSLRR